MHNIVALNAQCLDITASLELAPRRRIDTHRALLDRCDMCQTGGQYQGKRVDFKIERDYENAALICKDHGLVTVGEETLSVEWRVCSVPSWSRMEGHHQQAASPTRLFYRELNAA